MKNSIKLPLVAVPALVVTGVSLLVLLATVAGAASASKPGDLLYSLRGPAMRVQSLISNDTASDEAPAQNQIVAPKPASPSELSAPSVKNSNQKANDMQFSPEKSGSPASGVSNQSDDRGSKKETEIHKEDEKETETGMPKENENESETETGTNNSGGDDSNSTKSGGDDSSSTKSGGDDSSSIKSDGDDSSSNNGKK